MARLSSPLHACLLLAALSVVSVARADEAPQQVAAALRPAGDTLLAVGLERLAPALVRRAQAAADPGHAQLAAAVVAEPRLASWYGADASFVLTTPQGLSRAGEAVARWMGQARAHGLDLAALDARVAGYVQASSREAQAPPAAAPAVTAEDVRLAWARSQDGDAADRLARAAQALRVQVPALATPPAPTTPGLEPETRAAVEVALARGLFDLVTELPARPREIAVLEHPDDHYYLSPDVVWRGAPARVAAPDALAAAWTAARTGDLDAHLTGLVPEHAQYAALVAAALRYETICQAGEWATVDMPAHEKLATKPDAARAVQVRLAREGFYDGEPTGAWDEATAAAVLAYRQARQLKEKGLLDKDLAASLNVSCGERLRTLQLNVRRWRHSGYRGEPTRVQVNLAGQELRYFRDDTLAMMQRTVVGSSKGFDNERLARKIYRNATPVLMDHIAHVVLNPEWNVPPRIGREEIDPVVAADPAYIEKNHFRIVEAKNGGKYYRQAAGPWNALGQIKILFPNDESVYLHDTAGKAAFKLPVRALSHGCVRVQNALDFGMALLKADAEGAGQVFDEEAIRTKLMRRIPSQIDLVTQVPVFLEYYTASVDDAGVVRFHPDIYGYDAETFATAADAAP